MTHPVFLETASQIARRLCASAIWEGDRCCWIGLTPVTVPGGFKHLVQPLGPEVYSGAAGNVYFLSRLFRLTGDKEVKRTAEGAAREALTRLKEILPAVRIGFYSGWTGIGFALVELGEALGAGNWVDRGLRTLIRITKLDPTKQAHDFLLGIAGAIPALLNVYERYPEDWITEFACRLGDQLLKLAKPRDIGWSWQPFGPLSDLHHDNLTGLAHGASGNAIALLELYAVTGRDEYRHAAEEGFRYERHWYRSEFENWLDLRYLSGPDGDLNDGSVYQIQWCHGSVGIGLTRLRAFQLLGRTRYREEAEAAIHGTIRDVDLFPNNWQPNYSLCHGLCGNSEILLQGSVILGNDQWRSTAERVGWQGIELYEKQGRPWPSSLGKKEIPGLMTGVSGSAYFYLRLYDAARTPPITLVTSRRTSANVATLNPSSVHVKDCSS